MSHRCTHCNALRFEHEKKRTTLCCDSGKMSGLSNAFPAPAPQPLRDLLTSVPSEHQPLPPATKDFKQNIRAYNSALQMASTSLHIHSPEQGISMIAIKGAMHHLLGPLQPAEHDVPQFAQLYIIDSMDAQVTARLAALGATGAALHQPTLAGLHQMLHDHNTFVQRFKQVMDMPAHDLLQWEVVIKVDGNVDKRRYNAPTAPEVAGLLPGEVLQQCVLLCCLFVAIVHLMQCSSFIDINVDALAQATVTSRLQAGTSKCMHAATGYGGSVTCTLLTIRSTLCCSILMVSLVGSQACPMLLLPLSVNGLLAVRRKVMLGMLQQMQSQHNLHKMMATRRKVMLSMLQQMQGQHNLHKAKKSLHGSGLAIICTIGTRHHTPSLCMVNICIKSGLLTNIAKWNHNDCFTYATTKALCVLQFMVASLMQLPITTLTSTTWAGSLYYHPHSLVATDTWLNCTKIPWPLSANMASLICSSP